MTGPRDQSVLVKLSAGIACGLVMLGAAGVCVYRNLGDCEVLSAEMAGEVGPSRSALLALSLGAQDVRLNEMRLIGGDEARRRAALRDLDADMAAVNGGIEQYARLAATPDERRCLEALRSGWRDYRTDHTRLLALIERGDVPGALRLFDGRMSSTHSGQLDPAIRFLLQDDANRGATLARHAADRGRQTAIQSIGLLLALSVLFAGGGVLFSIRLSRGLRRLSEAARGLAGGRLDCEPDTSSRDELGQLAKALTELRTYQRELASIAERVAMGDMAVTIVPRSDDDRLSFAFAWMVNSLDVLMTEVAESRDRAVQWSRQQETEKQKMTVLLASIPSVLVGIDHDGVVLQWNSAAEQTLGVPSAQAIGRPLTECGAALDWSRVLDEVRKCLETRSCIRMDDVPFHASDGRPGLMGITLNPIQMGTGELDGVLFLGADITERRALEGQLAQAQKLESIGQLAAGIAHEINTPTQFIADNISFLDEAFASLLSVQEAAQALAAACKRSGAAPDDVAALDDAILDADWDYLSTEIPSAIRQSKDGVQRVAGIVQAMKEFSHPGVEAKVPFNLNHAIQTTATVARHEWRYAADLELALDPALPDVPGYPGDINQVVLNLVVNAAHAVSVASAASGQKGTIRLSTLLDGDFAEIQVADTGPGIPDAIRHRIFDPFFTTKEVGKGTGQGLAIAHSVVVDKHGGTIRFDSLEGRGTTFYVRLPLREAA